ncbi:MAG: DUF5060 domain-containing protein [Candidatus Marinimicrobia bacterium]|nr:DUF5060 domain-containing protein [Candidatus Neomarinimicrobiota bacterium]
MKKILLFLTIFYFSVWAQSTAYFDDFNDRIISHWTVGSGDQTTYELTEQDGALSINYHRVADTSEWHNVNFMPSEMIDVSVTPEIFLRIKSSVETKLSVKPIYSNGKNDWFDWSLSPQGSWQEMTFSLVPENFSGGQLTKIYFYLDGGTTTEKTGLVSIDEFRIGAGQFELQVFNLKATALGENKIQLDWECNDSSVVENYKIYRQTYPGFNCNQNALTDSVVFSHYLDSGLAVNSRYYYKVIGTDKSGQESNLSNEVSALTFIAGSGPTVSRYGTNSNTVGLYEKFEIIVELNHVAYTNPYDPEEIDLKAIFTSPTDSTWTINGFYDDYNNNSQWKIRFSPNEPGTWRYHLIATDKAGTGQSEVYEFTAVHSNFHGWVRPSKINPHYFEYDDGTSYYGIGAYYPWNMNENGMNRMAANGSNFVGIWNIMYDEGNIIESMASGLGRYDQPKCARIDRIIEMSEARNMKVMLAIWPHDLLSQTVWAHQWHQNPYNTICNVEEFFADEEAWQYQEKQYRYIIARWGYSRSLGVWEIVNEINGTDGWQQGRSAEATQWTRKVSTFLRNNDPFHHPNTANQSGGQWWPEGYDAVDIPNAHMYESGWSSLYPSNPHRSSVNLYATITRDFWMGWNKPAMFGEAGYTDIYGGFSSGSANYTISYHNTIWSSWANGIAVTPVWWDYPILSDDDLMQLRAFANFISNHIEFLDFAHIGYQPIEVSGNLCDVYAMGTDTLAFGWMRQINGSSPSGHDFTLSGLDDQAYAISYYDTWTGELISTDILFSRDGVANQILPEMTYDKPDIAFIISPETYGETPSHIVLTTSEDHLLNDGKSTAELRVVLKDEAGRFCGNATNEISFSIIGGGTFIGSGNVVSQGGVATVQYQAPLETGPVNIIASSPGLATDTVYITISNFINFDDFEGYDSSEDLGNYWKTKATSMARVYLEKINIYEGSQGMKFNYKIGLGAPPYSAIYREITADLSPFEYFGFWVKATGKSNQLALRLTEKGGTNWDYYIDIEGNEEKYHEIVLKDFIRYNGGSDTLRLANIGEISINILKGNGDFGESILFFDSFKFLTESSVVSVEYPQKPTEKFRLQQNYPNPFNPETTIEFQLIKNSYVTLQIYDLQGSLVATLLDENKLAGFYQLAWNATGYPSGIYIYKLISGNARESGKCVLLK